MALLGYFALVSVHGIVDGVGKGSSVHVLAADFDFLRKRIKTKSRTPEEESVGIDHGRLCIYNTK